jgi:hypothetical protein
MTRMIAGEMLYMDWTPTTVGLWHLSGMHPRNHAADDASGVHGNNWRVTQSTLLSVADSRGRAFWHDTRDLDKNTQSLAVCIG